MATKTEKPYNSIADEWLEEENLMLLECWARDGYTLQDIANRVGVSYKTICTWKKQYPEINAALRKGKEIIDYKVENALLKSALGYRTKEVKVTTLMRFGKVIETTKEVLEKDQAPNVTACQVWLFNRLPDKWKRNRDNIIDLDDEDSTIQVTVTRATNGSKAEKQQPAQRSSEEDIDEDWQDEVNTSIEISKNKSQSEADEENKANKQELKTARKGTANDSEDLDYWPDDWEDGDEDE